jgi:hypothetical protein
VQREATNFCAAAARQALFDRGPTHWGDQML